MKKIFITYGDEKFAKAKKRIIREAVATGWFDQAIAKGPEDISADLIKSGLMNIPRGGGLWSWKPDIILSVLQDADDGDIVVYADSGCSLQKSHEWDDIAGILKNKDIIAQRIYQPTDSWTRREIIEAFHDNPAGWRHCLQFCATVIILKKTKFSLSLISEWRDFILKNPEYIKDVPTHDRDLQHPAFIENRHDQSIYSALIFKHLPSDKIHTQWERIEDYDPICRQAIRATRLRNGETESICALPRQAFKRIAKIFILRPYYSLKKNSM